MTAVWAILKRAGAWLTANPLWGIIAALLAALGAAHARNRYLAARARAIRDEAARIRVEAEVRAMDVHAAALREDIEASRSDQVEAAREAEAAADEALDALERRKAIARKYRRNPLK